MPSLRRSQSQLLKNASQDSLADSNSYHSTAQAVTRSSSKVSRRDSFLGSYLASAGPKLAAASSSLGSAGRSKLKSARCDLSIDPSKSSEESVLHPPPLKSAPILRSRSAQPRERQTRADTKEKTRPELAHRSRSDELPPHLPFTDNSTPILPPVHLQAPQAAMTAANSGSQDQARAVKQQQSSHMLKTGRRGNPFCKDTHDLFATLMVSLELGPNTRFFRTYPNSFTTDDAANNLASLRFSQSNRTVDPNDPSRIITTTTTTTFSMTREIAKGICQHFMDAHLIENAADPLANAFKDRGIFQITPKGLHVLERFISKNGIASDNLVKVFVSQPICMKLLYLERNLTDDDVVVSRSVIETAFKRFAGGRHPNYIIDPQEVSRSPVPRPYVEGARPPPSFDRSVGVELQDVSDKGPKGNMVIMKGVFGSQTGVDWLLDFSTCVCRDEAAELLGHFVRMGYIQLHADKSRSGDKLVIVEVKSETQGQGMKHAEFRWGSRVTYRMSDEGRRIANTVAAAASSDNAQGRAADALQSRRANDRDDASSTSSRSRQKDRGVQMGSALSDVYDTQVLNGQLRDLFLSDLNDSSNWAKEQHSSTHRLRAILEEPMLRGLFREYLRSNYCDENLGFWLDVSEFRRRFSTTSSASGGRSTGKTSGASGSSSGAGATSAMEVHQQHLVTAAMQIYHNYLAPMSPNELNIDHNLRGDVVNFITKAQLDNAASGDAPIHVKKIGSPEASPDPQDSIPTIALRATQVQTLLRHYERIQDHIFRLLATDQVPKFIRTPKFTALLDSPEDANKSSSDTKSSSLKVTVS